MTYGEYRVGISFNPSSNEHNPEAIRLARAAIDDIDTAAMKGVKAVTKGPFNA